MEGYPPFACLAFPIYNDVIYPLAVGASFFEDARTSFPGVSSLTTQKWFFKKNSPDFQCHIGSSTTPTFRN